MAKSTNPAADRISAASLKSGVDFDSLAGEVSSARGEILRLEVGAVVGPLVITHKAEGVVLGSEPDARPVTTYDGRDELGITWRLPIGAIFVQKMSSLTVCPGDTIYVRRDSDVIKARGKGKGRPMEDYSIKVTARAQRSPAPVSN